MTAAPSAWDPTASTTPVIPADDQLLAELTPADCATVGAAQDEVVHRPLDRVLIVRGGPGTGKTVTALRRVARLIDEGRLDAAESLVVGPSTAFARYSAEVLSRWGHPQSLHRSVGELLPTVGGIRIEATHLTRLKGEARMAGLLARALTGLRAREPSDVPSTIVVDGREVPLDPAVLRRVVATAAASEASVADRRLILRGVLAAGAIDPRLTLDAADRLADRLWPSFAPTDLLRHVFDSRDLLRAAAGGEFSDREIDLLFRAAAEDPAFELWSGADLALLDEAAHLTGAGQPRYGHIVVNEAQDLSPMQLRAICRRAIGGSMTLVGDIAQSTGPWARDDWHDLVEQLPAEVPIEQRELRYTYRVPRQLFTLAAELLPMAAPSVEAPTAVRLGPAEPVIVAAVPADRGQLVLAATLAHEAAGRTVAVICPADCRNEIETLLDAARVTWRRPGDDRDACIVVVGPQEVKGLEFDAAIVVEPGHILDDDPRGHRLLYVALTRATGYLHLVGAADDLPADFGDPFRLAAQAASGEQELDPAVAETIDMVVQTLAETLLANLTPELWPTALNRLKQLIDPT